jgi:hypothetical protein
VTAFGIPQLTNKSKVEEIDGLDNAAELKKIQSKGLITVSFRFIHKIKSKSRPASQTPEPDSRRAETDLEKLGAVSEKALKGDARSHQARFVLCDVALGIF